MLRSINNSLRVALLLGGDSAEREISLASGAGVAAALQRAGHLVVAIDPATQDLATIAWQTFDVCFIALHGGAGEDGRIQRQLARLGVPYTGSGPEASELAMSKSASKERFLEAGVPTPRYRLFSTSDSPLRIAELVAQVGYPAIIKPESQGSSLGVSCVRSIAQLEEALLQCARFDRFGLAEQFIAGREFTVAVLDRQALPVLEIVSAQGLFTYESKYQSQQTEYRFDCDLPPGLDVYMQDTAVAAAASLGTTGLVRVDLMLDTTGQPWVLEVNTVPGMTERSLAPKAAARAGIDMTTLCDQLVRQPLAAEILK